MQEGEWYYCNVCSLGEAAILPHHRTTLHTPQPPALCPVTVPRAGQSCPPSRLPPAAAQPRHVCGAFQAVSIPCLRGPPALLGAWGLSGLQGPVRTLTPRAVLVLMPQVSLATLLLHLS